MNGNLSKLALLEANNARSDALVVESDKLKTKALTVGLTAAEEVRANAIPGEMRELLAMRTRLLAMRP